VLDLQFYYHGTNAIVFVVDSMDNSRFELAREELSRLLAQDELRGVPVLIYANKQDMPATTNPQVLSQKLGLDMIRDRPWFCQGCSATSGMGLCDGMDWLTCQLKAQDR
jgi:GTPase SAR1 family protein